MGALELALLQSEAPALVRFFIGLFLVMVVTVGVALITYWLNQGG
jgi:hypothetical protein